MPPELDERFSAASWAPTSLLVHGFVALSAGEPAPQEPGLGLLGVLYGKLRRSIAAGRRLIVPDRV